MKFSRSDIHDAQMTYPDDFANFILQDSWSEILLVQYYGL